MLLQNVNSVMNEEVSVCNVWRLSGTVSVITQQTSLLLAASSSSSSLSSSSSYLLRGRAGWRYREVSRWDSRGQEMSRCCHRTCSSLTLPSPGWPSSRSPSGTWASPPASHWAAAPRCQNHLESNQVVLCWRSQGKFIYITAQWQFIVLYKSRKHTFQNV